MRLTIIPADGTVIVDGNPKHQPLDLSGCGIPSDIHALQWYENRGWLEFENPSDPFLPKPPNEDIYSLPDWANAAVQVWTDWQPPAPPEPVDGLPQPNASGVETL